MEMSDWEEGEVAGVVQGAAPGEHSVLYLATAAFLNFLFFKIMMLQQHWQKSAPLSLLKSCELNWFNKPYFNAVFSFHVLIHFLYTNTKNIFCYLSHIVKPRAVVSF